MKTLGCLIHPYLTTDKHSYSCICDDVLSKPVLDHISIKLTHSNLNLEIILMAVILYQIIIEWPAHCFKSFGLFWQVTLEGSVHIATGLMISEETLEEMYDIIKLILYVIRDICTMCITLTVMAI